MRQGWPAPVNHRYDRREQHRAGRRRPGPVLSPRHHHPPLPRPSHLWPPQHPTRAGRQRRPQRRDHRPERAAHPKAQGGDQRVQAPDPGAAKPGAPLLVAVDPDDRVIDVEERERGQLPPAASSGPSRSWDGRATGTRKRARMEISYGPDARSPAVTSRGRRSLFGTGELTARRAGSTLSTAEASPGDVCPHVGRRRQVPEGRLAARR